MQPRRRVPGGTVWPASRRGIARRPQLRSHHLPRRWFGASPHRLALGGAAARFSKTHLRFSSSLVTCISGFISLNFIFLFFFFLFLFSLLFLSLSSIGGNSVAWSSACPPGRACVVSDLFFLPLTLLLQIEVNFCHCRSQLLSHRWSSYVTEERASFVTAPCLESMHPSYIAGGFPLFVDEVRQV